MRVFALRLFSFLSERVVGAHQSTACTPQALAPSIHLTAHRLTLSFDLEMKRIDHKLI